MIQEHGQLIMLVLLFVAVVLIVEGAWFYYLDVYSPRNRISSRMERLHSGEFHEQVQATLRRRASRTEDNLLTRAVTSIEVKLTQAGLKINAERFLVIMGLSTLGLAIFLPLLLGFVDLLTSPGAVLVVLLLAVGLGVIVPIGFLDRMATKRMKKFEEQFPVALDIFVRGLRAGHPISGALDLLVEEMPDPIGSEFALVVAEVSYGSDLRDALENLAQRVQTSDVSMFAVCVAIQAETGGNLADILEGLSQVIRDRNSMVLKVRALASEGKMTAVVLSILPIAAFAFVMMGNPRFYLDVAHEPMFMPGMIGIVFWYALGMFIIKRLITLKV